MPNNINTELSRLLQDHIANANLEYPIILPKDQLSEKLSKAAEIGLGESTGYINSFFDLLAVIGAVSLDHQNNVRFTDEIHAATVIAVSYSIQDGVSNLFDFNDSEDVENPYYGSWFLYQLEGRRLDCNSSRIASRVCEHVIILVKARLDGQDAILFQHEGNRAWGKYKLIGGRVRSEDHGDLIKTAHRELRQEVRTKQIGAEINHVNLLSSKPHEYTSISRRLGAFTLYKCYAFECELELPKDCLFETFLGEKGRETTWLPIDQISLENEFLTQKNILKWILDNRWIHSCKLSTNQPIKGGAAKLRNFLVKHFNLEELKDLCFQLNIDYENLLGEGKESKIISLVSHFERRGKIDVLEDTSRSLRPNIK